MKKDIHPTYYNDAKVICSCGSSFTTGSTQKEIHTEICSACHPFFTGTQKIVDSARRVEKYKEKVDKSSKIDKKVANKTTKRAIKKSKKADK